MIPALHLLRMTGAAVLCMGGSCSRQPQESRVKGLQSERASLLGQIEQAKGEIATLQRDALLHTPKPASRDADDEPESTGDSSGQALAAAGARCAMLKERNGQMRVELEAYQRRHTAH